MQKLTALVKERPQIIFVSLITLLAFILRYWFFWRYPYPLMLHEQDGIAYMSIAKDIRDFKAPANLFMPPFYPLVIALFSILPVKLEIAARVASVTMDALTVLPLYGLSRVLLPRVASLAVCFLWATFGFSLYYSASPLSQPTYLFTLLCGTYLLYLALQNAAKLHLFALAGFFLSAAYLTRPEGIVSIGAAAFLVLIRVVLPSEERKVYAKGGLILAGVFLLTALPYLILLRNQLGFWTFTGKTSVAIKGIDGSLTINSNAEAAKTGLALWLEQFGGVSGGIKFILGNLAGFWVVLKSAFSQWMTYTALAGIPFLILNRNILSRLIFLLPISVVLPVFVANLPKDFAYIYPIYPLVLISFTVALWFIANSVGKVLNFLSLPSKIASALTFLILSGSLPAIAVNNFSQTTATFTDPQLIHNVNMTNSLMKPVAADLKRYSGEKDIVMTRWGLVSYYAERPLMSMPKGSIDQVLAAGRQAGVKFIVIDTESVETRRQELAPLLAPLYGKSVDAGLGIEVVSIGNSDYGGYVLYRYR